MIDGDMLAFIEQVVVPSVCEAVRMCSDNMDMTGVEPQQQLNEARQKAVLSVLKSYFVSFVVMYGRDVCCCVLYLPLDCYVCTCVGAEVVFNCLLCMYVCAVVCAGTCRLTITHCCRPCSVRGLGLSRIVRSRLNVT